MNADSGNAGSGFLLTKQDIRDFKAGTHRRLHEVLGAHPGKGADGEDGTYFAVWAPNARRVSVIGDFNEWDPARDVLRRRRGSGIWEGWVAGAKPGHLYKFRIRARYRGGAFDKADPFARTGEEPPRTASIIWEGGYEWGDSQWMEDRGRRNSLESPISIYEVHLGSWRRPDMKGEGLPGYRELAPQLAEYVRETGFTHVELLPVMEHPFFGSWGYQCTGYFAPGRRQGTPDDLMYLIDHLHQAGIGVILDWVPSHFPSDPHSLGRFDGTPLYEHPDPRRGYHPDWTSLVFDYGRPEVQSFLLSSALFWLSEFHVDGLRVDAVASMLYLDYSRQDGEWLPNRYGGNENLEAVAFLKKLNEVIYAEYPDVQTFAEESTAWPGVSHPTFSGGLGFGLKWDMGWMNDTLAYMSRDPSKRSSVHNKLTFRGVYAGSENFVLPLSHDEVVYGKKSLFGRMPGKEAEKLADLRLLLGYMFGLNGKKLLFMGGEFAQRGEWNHDLPLHWELLEEQAHARIREWVRALNDLYAGEPSLHRFDCDPAGFRWINPDDSGKSVLTFLRSGGEDAPPIVVVCNFSGRRHEGYRLGVPRGGVWTELLNSEWRRFGGGVAEEPVSVEAEDVEADRMIRSIVLTLPPRSVTFLK